MLSWRVVRHNHTIIIRRTSCALSVTLDLYKTDQDWPTQTHTPARHSHTLTHHTRHTRTHACTHSHHNILYHANVMLIPKTFLTLTQSRTSYTFYIILHFIFYLLKALMLDIRPHDEWPDVISLDGYNMSLHDGVINAIMRATNVKLSFAKLFAVGVCDIYLLCGNNDAIQTVNDYSCYYMSLWKCKFGEQSNSKSTQNREYSIQMSRQGYSMERRHREVHRRH